MVLGICCNQPTMTVATSRRFVFALLTLWWTIRETQSQPPQPLVQVDIRHPDWRDTRDEITKLMMTDPATRDLESQFVTALVLSQEEFRNFEPPRSGLSDAYSGRFRAFQNCDKVGTTPRDRKRDEHSEEKILANLDEMFTHLADGSYSLDIRPVVVVFSKHIPCTRIDSARVGMWTTCSIQLPMDMGERESSGRQGYLLAVAFATSYSRPVNEREGKRIDFTDVTSSIQYLHHPSICLSIFIRNGDFAAQNPDPQTLRAQYSLSSCLSGPRQDPIALQLVRRYRDYSVCRSYQQLLVACLWTRTQDCSCVKGRGGRRDARIARAGAITTYAVNYGMSLCSTHTTPNYGLVNCLQQNWVSRLGPWGCQGFESPHCVGDPSQFVKICLQLALHDGCHVGSVLNWADLATPRWTENGQHRPTDFDLFRGSRNYNEVRCPADSAKSPELLCTATLPADGATASSDQQESGSKRRRIGAG